MPNHEDEYRRRQRSSPGSQQPDMSAQPGAIRRSAGFHASTPGGQSSQQPLVLGAPDAVNIETPHPHARNASGASPTIVRQSPGSAAVQQPGDDGLELIHYIFIGFDLLLVVACILVYIFLIRNAGLFNSGNLLRMVVLLVIFLSGAGLSFWLGRYQNNTLAHQENRRLSEEITRLKTDMAYMDRDNAGLRQQIRSLQSAAATTAGAETMAAASPSVNPVVQPRPIEPVQPPPSIYDNPREPDDRSDLPFHPHEKIFPGGNEQSGLTHGWHIVGASRRGFGHAYEGKYREDDFSIKPFNFSDSKRYSGGDIALVAIADGVSSKELSRRGARAAVLAATALPPDRVRSLKTYLGKDAEFQQCQQQVYSLLVDAVKAARRGVEDCAQYYSVGIDDLQSTLLIFLAAPWDEQRILVASTQIGDGVLFTLQPRLGQAPRQRWGWLQKPQIGGAGNEVKPFMRASMEEWGNYFQCDLLDSATGCIMGMTDGTADDIEPPRATTANPDPDPFFYVEDFYQRIILPSFTSSQPGAALVKTLGYRKKQSYDDRTVVCVYHS